MVLGIRHSVTKTKHLMYLLIILFEIPNNKLHEFNLALERLIKWPVYMLHNSETKSAKNTFEMARTWKNEESMKRDLSSHMYQNLMGAIKVLGNIDSSHLYSVKERTDLLLEYEH